MECHGWYYVGVHCGDIFKDNYFGSGLAWLNVVQKHGEESVVRKVLALFGNRKEKQDLERRFIKEIREKYGDRCVNISDGGDGGNLGEEVCRRIAIKIRGAGNGMYGKKLSEESKRKISAALKGHPNYNPKGYRHTEEAKRRIAEKHMGMGHTEATKEKLRATRLKQTNLVLTGARGGHWYVNPDRTMEKYIINTEPPTGWKRGRKELSLRGCMFYHNGEREVRLNATDIPPVGFVHGHLHRPTFTAERNKKISMKLKGRKMQASTRILLSKAIKGRRWYNNGIEQRQTWECPEGWVRGMLHRKERIKMRLAQ